MRHKKLRECRNIRTVSKEVISTLWRRKASEGPINARPRTDKYLQNRCECSNLQTGNFDLSWLVCKISHPPLISEKLISPHPATGNDNRGP